MVIDDWLNDSQFIHRHENRRCPFPISFPYIIPVMSRREVTAISGMELQHFSCTFIKCIELESHSENPNCDFNRKDDKDDG